MSLRLTKRFLPPTITHGLAQALQGRDALRYERAPGDGGGVSGALWGPEAGVRAWGVLCPCGLGGAPGGRGRVARRDGGRGTCCGLSPSPCGKESDGHDAQHDTDERGAADPLMVDEDAKQDRPDARKDGGHNEALPYPYAGAQGKEPGDIGGDETEDGEGGGTESPMEV